MMVDFRATTGFCAYSADATFGVNVYESVGLEGDGQGGKTASRGATEHEFGWDGHGRRAKV